MGRVIIPASIAETLSEQVKLLKEDSVTDYNRTRELRENALVINEIARTFIEANKLL